MHKSIRGKLLQSYLLIIGIFMVSAVSILVEVAHMSNLTNELVATQWPVEKLLDDVGDHIDSIAQNVTDRDDLYSSVEIDSSSEKN